MDYFLISCRYGGLCLFMVACCVWRCCAEDFDLFIFAGQSNAVGFETTPDQLPAEAADAKIPFFFDCGDPPFDWRDSSSSNRWTFLRAQPRGNPAHDAKARQYGNFYNAAGGFGPEMSFARTLFHTQRFKPAIFKFAYNGTSFANTNDWSPGRPLYREMLARYESARGQLEQGGTNRATLRALVWIQGESDCGQGQTAYEQRFGEFIRQLRLDLCETNLLVLAGFNTNFNGNTAGIVRAQQALAVRDGRVCYVEIGGAALTKPAPTAHFNTEGTLEVGERFAQAYLAAR